MVPTRVIHLALFAAVASGGLGCSKTSEPVHADSGDVPAPEAPVPAESKPKASPSEQQPPSTPPAREMTGAGDRPKLFAPLGRWWIYDGLYYVPVPFERQSEMKEEEYGYSLDGRPVLINAAWQGAPPFLAAAQGPVALKVVNSSLTDETMGPAVRELAGKVPVSMTLQAASDEHMVHFRGLPRLEVLRIFDTAVTAAGIAELGDLPSLAVIDLDSTPMTVAAIEAMAGLPALRWLRLHACAIDDAVMAEVGALEQLVGLHLSDNEFGEPGFAALRALQHLEVLSLEKTPLPEGSMVHLGALRRLRVLDLSRRLGADGVAGTEGTAHLAALHDLEWVALPANEIEALPDLSNWPKLRHLDLVGNPIPTEGLPGLQSLRELEVLDLRGTKVDGAVVARLGDKPALVQLRLPESVQGDDALAGLGTCCARLTDLTLDGTGAGPKTLGALAALPELTRLRLNDTSIGDEELRQLAGASSLRRLELRNTKITDAGLEALRSLPKLESLDLQGTAVSAAEGFRDGVQVSY